MGCHGLSVCYSLSRFIIYRAMSFFHRICPCCFGTQENDTYRMHQQAQISGQPTSRLEGTLSQHTPRSTFQDTTAVDESNHHSVPLSTNAKDISKRTRQDLVCLLCYQYALIKLVIIRLIYMMFTNTKLANAKRLPK